MPTSNCGCPDVTNVQLNCGETTQSDCGCPIPATDASCIYYNLTKDTGGLPCLNIANGTNLKSILEAIDAKLCTLTPFNFSLYDLGCLTSTYVIENFKDFAEAVANEICQVKSNINILSNNITVLNTKIDTINIPVITNDCIGILPSDTLKQILQKIVNYVDCNITAPVDNSPSIVAIDSSTIDFVTSGTKNHNITASVKVSTSAGNTLQVLGNGLFVPTPPTQVPQVLGFNSSTRIVSLSNGGGSFALPPDLDNQILSLDIVNRILSISNGNSVDLTPLFTSLSISETLLTTNNSNSILFTTSGTANHTLTASVKIDSTQPNAVSINSNGLFVTPQQSISTAQTDSITLNANGLFNHNISADIRIDTTQPNALTVGPNGLHVPLSTATITPQNGLSGTPGIVELGGDLLKHTLVNDSSLSKQYNLAFNAKSIIFGSEHSTYLTATNEFEFGNINVKDITSNSLVNTNSYYDVCFNNNIVGSGKIISSLNSILRYNSTTAITIQNSTPVTGNLSGLLLKSNINNNTTLLQASGLSGTATRALSANYSYIDVLPEASANTSVISHVAASVIASPYYLPAGSNFATITNYYGLLINPSDSFNTSLITNRFGIYQEGVNDKNIFLGHMVYKKSYTPTSTADTTGETGSVTWDDSYVYVKTSVGWKRTALSTF